MTPETPDVTETSKKRPEQVNGDAEPEHRVGGENPEPLVGDQSPEHPAGDSEPDRSDGEEGPEDPEQFDDDDAEQHQPRVKPWDPAKIRITTKNFTLREIVEQIKEGEIDLAPDFQRDFVWKTRQRTRLVESILLGIPLPAFYFNQEEDGSFQVVDGVQRLSTIHAFMRDEHVLEKKDLEYLGQLAELTFSKLDVTRIRRFKGTQIVVHVIEPQTPDEVKYDIFSRVNTLGSPLSHQEIRHAMSKQRSRDFLKQFAESQAFDQATFWKYWTRSPSAPEGRVRNSGRMANRELALRFCAFRHFDLDEYREYDSLNAYLGAFTKRIDGRSTGVSNLTDDELEALGRDFETAMGNAHAILGKAAFRRWPPGQKRRGPINRAVFESQAIALADYSLKDLLPHSDSILAAFRSAFEDPTYTRAVTVGTGDPARVDERIKWTRTILRGIV